MDKEQFRSLPASIANARAYRAQALGDVSGTVTYARQALDLLQEGDYYERGTTAALLGLAYWASGNLEAAHRSFADGLASIQMAGGILIVIGGTSILAYIRMAQGRLHEAVRTYEQSLQLATEQGEPVLQGTAELYLGLSELHRERGDLEAARQYLLRGEALREQASLPGYEYLWCVAQARIKEAQGKGLVDRLQAACAEGSSSFHSTGLNPGWMGDLIPLTMSALSRTIERIHVLEISNFQGYPSPEIMFEAMGFGSEPEQFERSGERRRNWLNGLFRESVQMVADGIGLELDDVSSQVHIELAPEDLQTAAGLVRKGTVAGQHWEWAGQSNGVKRVIHETVWRMHESVAPDWARGNHSVTIEGSPRMRLEFAPDYINDGLLGTAMHAVNAIVYVCEAQPGIRTLLDLPWVMGRVAD